VFITDAYAQAAEGAAQGASPLMSMLPLILMFVVLYFLLMRPQMKRQKEHRQMVEALGKGDEVIAAGGIYGRVTKLSDSIITIEIADGVEIQVQRGAVAQVLPKGTIK
jgi:preprotein translocase subunit YajC